MTSPGAARLGHRDHSREAERNPEEALFYFRLRLAYEVDPGAVYRERAERRDRYVLVDARSASDYRRAHLPGALNIPSASALLSTLGDLVPGKAIVCYGETDARSDALSIAAALSAAGREAAVMRGGLRAWLAEGFPVEQGGKSSAGEW